MANYYPPDVSGSGLVTDRNSYDVSDNAHHQVFVQFNPSQRQTCHQNRRQPLTSTNGNIPFEMHNGKEDTLPEMPTPSSNSNHTLPVYGMQRLGFENYSSMPYQSNQITYQPMTTTCSDPVICDPNGNVHSATRTPSPGTVLTGSPLCLSVFTENENETGIYEWLNHQKCSPENGPVGAGEADIIVLQKLYEQSEQEKNEHCIGFNRENTLESTTEPLFEDDNSCLAHSMDSNTDTIQQEILEENREILMRRYMGLKNGKTIPSLKLFTSASGKNEGTDNCQDIRQVKQGYQIDCLNENVNALNFAIDTTNFINQERKRSCKFDNFQEHISKKARMDNEPDVKVELNYCVSINSGYSSTSRSSDEQVADVRKVDLELSSTSESSDEQDFNIPEVNPEKDVMSCKSSQFFIKFHNKKLLCLSKGRYLAKEKHLLMKEFLDRCFEKSMHKKVFKLKMGLKIQFVPIREEYRKGTIGYMKKNGLVSNNSKCTNIGLIDVRHANILYHAFHGEKDCHPCFTLHKSRKNATFDALSSGDVPTCMGTVAVTENSGDGTASLGTDAVAVISKDASANMRTAAATVSRQNIIPSSCRGNDNCDDTTGKTTTNTALLEAKKIPKEVCTPEAEADYQIGWGKPMVDVKMNKDGVIFSIYKTDYGGVLELFGKSMRYIVVYDQKYIPLVDIYNSFDEKEVLKTIQRANINVFSCTQQEAKFLNDFMDFDSVKAGESIVIGRILYHVIMSPDEYRKKDSHTLTGDAG